MLPLKAEPPDRLTAISERTTYRVEQRSYLASLVKRKQAHHLIIQFAISIENVWLFVHAMSVMADPARATMLSVLSSDTQVTVTLV